jgi:hypothetical protein
MNLIENWAEYKFGLIFDNKFENLCGTLQNTNEMMPPRKSDLFCADRCVNV